MGPSECPLGAGGGTWGGVGSVRGEVPASVVGIRCSLSCLLSSVSLAPLPLPLPCFCPGFGLGQCQHTALTVGSTVSLYVCPARRSWSPSPA